MKFNLNLITIGLLAASASVNAADFSVKQANTSKVNTSAYQCKSCTVKQGYQGEVNANIGWANSDDIHSGNSFGDSDAGWRGSVGQHPARAARLRTGSQQKAPAAAGAFVNYSLWIKV